MKTVNLIWTFAKITKTPSEGAGSYATIGDTKYSVYLDHSFKCVLLFDASSEYEATSEFVTTRPVIGIISVDNYDDLEGCCLRFRY